MGDGRYYTFRQFFAILYYTVISVGLTSSIVYISLKARVKKQTWYLLMSCGFLLFYIVVAFIKEVTYGIGAAAALEYVGVFGVIGWFMTFIWFYTKSVKSIILNLLFLAVVTSMPFIDSFEFTRTQYSGWYKVCIGLMLIELLVLSFYGLVKKFRGSQSIKYEYYESLIRGLSVLIVAIFYLIYICIPDFKVLFEIGIFIHWIGLNLIFMKFMPEEKIPIGYHHLIENMVDTLIIVNEDKRVIYSNETAITQLLKLDQAIDLNHIENLFDLEHIVKVNLGHKINQINGMNKDAIISCKVRIETVVTQKKHLSYVVIIEDCTHLEQMIVELKESKSELKKIERELIQYTKTSKVLTAEKERNKLLIQVQNDLGHDLAALTKFLENILAKMGDSHMDKSDLEHNLSEGVSLARSNLKNIRETVKVYRETYDGKG